MRVLQYYLAGWHIKPKGVKKPYNPILGEFFRCRYEYADGTQGFYVSEQGMLRIAMWPRSTQRLRSLTPPARLCLLLYFPCKSP
jgi:hypothetical protein